MQLILAGHALPTTKGLKKEGNGVLAAFLLS